MRRSPSVIGFLRIQVESRVTNDGRQELDNPKSNLSINGFAKGRIEEHPQLIKPNLLNNKFMDDKKKKIVDSYKDIMVIQIQNILLQQNKQLQDSNY